MEKKTFKRRELRPEPKPEWLKIRLSARETFQEVSQMVNDLTLHTVCQEARCPNIYECFSHRTATFMLLGDICTRHCGFCAVTKGKPRLVDPEEPRHVAEAVKKLMVVTGAGESQVEAISWGKEKPKALGHDEAAWAENRRADIAYPDDKK